MWLEISHCITVTVYVKIEKNMCICKKETRAWRLPLANFVYKTNIDRRKNLRRHNRTFYAQMSHFIVAINYITLWWRKKKERKECNSEKCKQCFSICKLFLRIWLYFVTYSRCAECAKPDFQYALYFLQACKIFHRWNKNMFCK